MADIDEKVLVVPTRNIFGTNQPFNGFRTPEESGIPKINDFLSTGFRLLKKEILQDQAKSGGSLEQKQIVPYIIIVNSGTSQIYAFRQCERPRDEATENRGMWYLGLGTTIGITDHYDRDGDGRRYFGEELIRRSKERMISERLKINGRITESKILGFINEEETEELVAMGVDENNLERETLGIAYLLKTDAVNISFKDNKTLGGMTNFGRVEEIITATDKYLDGESEERVFLDPWSRMVYFSLQKTLQAEEELSKRLKAGEEDEKRQRHKRQHGRADIRRN